MGIVGFIHLKSDTSNPAPAHVAFDSLHYEYSLGSQSALRLTQWKRLHYCEATRGEQGCFRVPFGSTNRFLAASGGLYDLHRVCRSHCEPGCILPSIGIQSRILLRGTRSRSCRIWCSNFGAGFQVTHRDVDSIAEVYLHTNLNFIIVHFVIRLLTNFTMSPAIKNHEPNLDISFQGNINFPAEAGQYTDHP